MPIIADKQGIRGISNPSIPAQSPLGSEKITTPVYPQVSEDIECTSPLTSLKFSSDLQVLNLGGELWQPHAARSCYNEEQITSALDCQDQTDGEQGTGRWKGGEEETVARDSVYRADWLSKQNIFTWCKRDPSNLSAVLFMSSANSRSEGYLDFRGKTRLEPIAAPLDYVV